MNTYTDVALAFAQALVDQNFERAFTLLSPEMQRELSPLGLRKRLWEIFEGYAPDDRPLRAVLDPEHVTSTNADWAMKQPDDLGWAYISILGEEFVEAVTVTVAQINGAPLIRDVQWGPP